MKIVNPIYKVNSYLQMLNEHLKKGKHWGDTGMRSSNFITLNDTWKLMTEKEKPKHTMWTTEVKCVH